MVFPILGRLADQWLGRGEGLDERGDPFGPPLDGSDMDRLLESVRRARFEESAPPFSTPVPVAGTPPRVPVVLRRPKRGGTEGWCVLATPYGAYARAGALGLYERHAAALLREGFGVATFEPPFHGGRTIPGRPSGWGFVTADLGHTTRAVCAAAAEAAALARWLREHGGAERVAGFGISLGGSAVGLAAALGAPFDRLAFLAAVDNPASFYGTGRNREARRRTLAKAGYDLARVARAFAPAAPSTYAAPAPALFAVPREDLVVPAETQEAWRRAWGGALADLRWEGHALALASPRVARRIAAWLAAG